MVLMALDHTRDFFHSGVFRGEDPLDLSHTSVLLFLTRWITHFCAPVFVFLAGTGAFLSKTRGKTVRDLSWYLVTRGLWLVLLELTWVRWAGWSFTIDLHEHWGNVIWAIGWSMVVLAALIHLPVWAIASFGLVMIATHNAFDGIKPDGVGVWSGLWRVLHAGGAFELAPGYRLGAGYPLIPWIGVMAVGYSFGEIVRRPPEERRRWFVRLGLLAVALFVVVRLSNLYGDPTPWSPQKNGLFTFLAILDCHKYPPSLCYLLMTLGPALLVLACLDGGTPGWLRWTLVFGRVPLFYYVLHLPLIHGLSVIVHWLRFGHADWLWGNIRGIKPPEGAGFDLWGVYLAWATVLMILYPACNWFAALKRRRRDAWLSYL